MVGHQKIIKVLEKELARENLSQAYLFCGPESVGKKSVAFWLAGKILGREDIENHPDFILLEPESQEKNGVIKKGEIKIEGIRSLQKKLSLTSHEGGGKVVVADEAEKMNVSAQNSLLKTLEEANDNTTVILVTGNEKKILPTIISRCRKVKFGLVKNEEIEKMIPIDHGDKELIIFWSFGRPGIAKKLISDEKELSFMKESFQEFRDLFSGQVFEKFSLAEKLSSDVPALFRKIDTWSSLLRLSLLGQSAKIKISPKKSLRILEEIERSLEKLKSSNASSRLILENLFLSF